jgi:hypothetical protein
LRLVARVVGIALGRRIKHVGAALAASEPIFVVVFDFDEFLAALPATLDVTVIAPATALRLDHVAPFSVDSKTTATADAGNGAAGVTALGERVHSSFS